MRCNRASSQGVQLEPQSARPLLDWVRFPGFALEVAPEPRNRTQIRLPQNRGARCAICRLALGWVHWLSVGGIIIHSHTHMGTDLRCIALVTADCPALMAGNTIVQH